MEQADNESAATAAAATAPKPEAKQAASIGTVVLGLLAIFAIVAAAPVLSRVEHPRPGNNRLRDAGSHLRSSRFDSRCGYDSCIFSLLSATPGEHRARTIATSPKKLLQTSRLFHEAMLRSAYRDRTRGCKSIPDRDLRENEEA
jgi:hypothetical protein